MAIGRTQIRLGALTGSLSAAGTKIVAGALDVDSLQGSLDALAAAMQRQIGAVPVDSWYSLDTDVLSIASTAVISGSLTLKNGSSVEKAKLTDAGYMSGSGVRIGSLGAANATIFSEVNADLSIGPGPETAWSNRHIILDGGTAGTTGGVRAVVQASGGKFTVAASGAPTTAVAHITDAGALSGSSYVAGGVTIGDSWATVKGAYLADSAGHNRLTFVDGAAVEIRNDAGSAAVVSVADTAVTVTGDITGSVGLRLTGAVGDRILHVDAGNAQFDNDVGVTGNVTITGNLDVNGTTTTIDTEQLSVQDSVIAMGMSGSGVPGPAGDRGLFMSIRGESDPALVWSEIANTFALCRTATSPSASMGTIALTADADLRVGDLAVRGGDIDLSNAATILALKAEADALQYKQGATLLGQWDTVSAATYGLEMQDEMALWFGGDKDGKIVYVNGTDDLIISGSGATDIKLGVDAGDDIKAQIAGSDVLAIGGAILKTDSTKVVGPTATSFILSSSAGRDIKVSSTGGNALFADGLILGSTWTSDSIKLSNSSAEWNDYVTNFGDGASLLNAIAQAKGSAQGASKSQFPITSGIAEEANLSTATGASVINMTGTSGASRDLGCNVYVNGQLMHSGSVAQMQADTADYCMNIVTNITQVDFRFGFPIITDDVVVIVQK
jgi:hypothetical protein